VEGVTGRAADRDAGHEGDPGVQEAGRAPMALVNGLLRGALGLPAGRRRRLPLLLCWPVPLPWRVLLRLLPLLILGSVLLAPGVPRWLRCPLLAVRLLRRLSAAWSVRHSLLPTPGALQCALLRG